MRLLQDQSDNDAVGRADQFQQRNRFQFLQSHRVNDLGDDDRHGDGQH